MPGTCRLLLVEDSQEQADLVRDYLALVGEYQIDWAPDLQSFWDLVQRGGHDLVLMDYRLPDGTGLDALEGLKQGGWDLPVVMVSGQGDERIAAQIILNGAADYIVKKADYFLNLPSVIQKALHEHQLNLAVKQSLDKIRFQSVLLDNVRDAIVAWDAAGLITYWNHSAVLLFGWSSEEVLGKPVTEHYFTCFNPVYEFQPHARDTWMGERRAVLRNGQERWVSSHITILSGNGDQQSLSGYLDVVRDISERKQMETLLKTASTQLAQAARLSTLSELASGVAHRISNPLATIIASAHLLKERFGDLPDVLEMLEDVEVSGWKAQEVVGQLLAFSRPVGSYAEVFPISETIQNAIDLVGSKIQASGVNLALNFCKEPLHMQGNARQVEDLWVNLLLLARDALLDQGPHSIILTTRLEEGWGVVEVKDNGRPIPGDHMQRVFEPDFVGSEIGRGTGLELSICREIVRQQKGTISAQRTGDDWTVFQVKFPLHNS